MGKTWRLQDREHGIQRLRLERSLEEEIALMAEDEVTEVFIIENTWWIGGGDSEGHANLTVWATEEAAQEELYRLGRQQGITIGPEQSSFEDGEDVYFINRYELGEI